MNLDIKSLKKLAKTCREAGIKHYKDQNFEFTLTDDAPEPKASPKRPLAASPDVAFQSDSPSDEELLYWSATGTLDSLDENTEAS